MSKISNQVKLPVNVAFEVVMQGIRIRIWRSVVTMLGVALGIAFLMSILAGQQVKQGVADEEAMRQDVDRMYNFLTAEIGQPRGRTLAIHAAGALNEPETRLLTRLAENRLGRAAVSGDLGLTIPELNVSGTDGLESIDGILLIGEAPATVDGPGWDGLRAAFPNAPVAYTRIALAVDGGVPLARALSEDEIAKKATQAKQARFRSIWIIIISLAVTVICISNSMLMSVTERFREIGTMKCLGALSAFIRRIFLIESSLTGFVGSIVGSFIGALFSVIAYSVTFGPGLVLGSLSFGSLSLSFLICVVAGVGLSVIAAIYPATIASRMVPADALRSNI